MSLAHTHGGQKLSLKQSEAIGCLSSKLPARALLAGAAFLIGALVGFAGGWVIGDAAIRDAAVTTYSRRGDGIPGRSFKSLGARYSQAVWAHGALVDDRWFLVVYRAPEHERYIGTPTAYTGDAYWATLISAHVARPLHWAVAENRLRVGEEVFDLTRARVVLVAGNAMAICEDTNISLPMQEAVRSDGTVDTVALIEAVARQSTQLEAFLESGQFEAN